MAQCIQMPPHITVCLQGWGRHGWSSSHPALNSTGSSVRLLHRSPLKQKWLKEWSVSRPIRPRHPVSVVKVLLHACTGDSVNPFVPNFLLPVFSFLPPLRSPPVESEFFSRNHWFLGRLILKSYSFIRPPSGLWVWLSVTDPERSRLILHEIQTEQCFKNLN